MSTTTEEALVADDNEHGPPRGPGRPRLGTGDNSAGTGSKQQSIIFGATQPARINALSGKLATSRNRLVERALRELADKHGTAIAPPIPLIPSGGMKNQAQYIPSPETNSIIAELTRGWGVTGHDVRRIAVELLLQSEGFPPPADAKGATTDG